MTLTPVPVTQRDRDAAVAWYRADGHFFTDNIVEGFEDDGSLVQAFAHHAEQARLSGYNQGVAEERERIAAWIEDRKYGDIVHDHETEQHDGTCDEFATAIRAIRI